MGGNSSFSHHQDNQEIVGCTPPYPTWALYIYGESLKKRPYKKWVFMGYNPQESLENTIKYHGDTYVRGTPVLVP